jgi:co-chaperonin GroES (HSP10)
VSDELCVAACNQHVLCQVLDEGKAFGADSPLVNIAQTIGHKDRAIICRVLTSGPGNVSRGTLNPSKVRSGDLVVVNLYHLTHEVRVDGPFRQTFNWENIMARLDECADGSHNLDPLQGYILCKRNEARAARIMMGEQGRIHLPGGDSHLTGNVVTDERGKKQEQLRVAVEEVIKVGPGQVVDGLWQEPPQVAGNMVMYDTSVAPVQIRVGGESYTLVHMRHVILTFWNAGDQHVPANATQH